MVAPVIKHSVVTGAAANSDVLVDGPAWDASHTVTGLENIDNTSDANKPVSTATQSALDAKVSIGVDQHITAAGPVAVANNSGIVRVDQTVGAAMTLTMGLAAAKTCPVLIADWKGDAGTNNITINPSGSEKIQGLSSWTIAADNGSIFLRPIAGVGYAI